MKKTSIFFGIVFALTLAGCAQQQVNTETSSGFAERTVPNADSQEISSNIVNSCLDRGYGVQTNTENRVVCTSPIEGAANVLLRAGVGGEGGYISYSFIINQISDDVRVVAQPSIDSQTRTGQTQSQSLRGNAAVQNSLQDFLNTL